MYFGAKKRPALRINLNERATIGAELWSTISFCPFTFNVTALLYVLFC